MEFDSYDFSRVVLLLKAKAGKIKVIRLAEIVFAQDSEKPPGIVLREFCGSRSWRLEQSRYSPRWSSHRAAEELIQHTVTALPSAWVP